MTGESVQGGVTQYYDNGTHQSMIIHHLQGAILQRMLQLYQLSESERLERSETQNCSQNDLQLRLLPSKVGTLVLGSFTPFPSKDVVGGSYE